MDDIYCKQVYLSHEPADRSPISCRWPSLEVILAWLHVPFLDHLLVQLEGVRGIYSHSEQVRIVRKSGYHYTAKHILLFVSGYLVGFGWSNVPHKQFVLTLGHDFRYFSAAGFWRVRSLTLSENRLLAGVIVSLETEDH